MSKKTVLKNFFFTIFIAVVLMTGGGLLANAVEFPQEEGDVQKEGEIQKEESEETVEEYQDAGVETIQDLQDSPSPPYQPKDAEEQARDYIEKKGLYEGFNPEKKIFVQIGEASFDSEDPSYDNSFIIKRSLKTMEASLEAKSRIIEFIRTEMSAIDQAITPGTDLNTLFREEAEKAEGKMEAQRKKLAELLDKVDRTQAEALRGVTFGDRLNAAMDAAIKKLDKEYSTNKMEEKKIQKFEKAKQKYQEASKAYTELEKKVEAQRGTVTEKLSSKVKTISKMPLFGAVSVAQFESWDEDDERYRVALVVIWSSKMERLTRAFISGEDFKVPPGDMSVREWIKNEGQGWATATGGRRFRDNTGTPFFIGIAASPIGKSASSEKKARGVSEMMAKKEVAMAIFSDVESYKQAGQMMETRGGGSGKDSSLAAETFSNKLQQKIEKRQIHGLQRMYGRKLIHPISQQRIYVTIYGVSGQSAKKALMIQERNYLTKILDVKHQQKLKGKTDAYKSKVQEARQDKSEYYKSKAATSKKINERDSQGYNKSKKRNRHTTSQRKDESKGGRSQSGTYTGAGADSFDW